ncbi:MAG: ABC transporter ATP-binding protein/permease [Desulfobacterales bacterium]|nr:ABC transporter ATP-binding protein/permease [Desulfobacterales bacterium]
MYKDFGYAEENMLGKPYDIKLMKKLYPFTKPYRLTLIFAVFMVILLTLLDLSIPYVTKVTIDRYIVPALNGSNQQEHGQKIRHLPINTTDKKALEIIQKNPDLFEFSGNTATVSIERLSELSKKDLTYLRGDDLRGVSTMAVLLLTIVILHMVINFTHVMMMELAGQKIMHDLRIRLFAHIQSLSVSFFTKNPTGRLVTRVTSDIQNMHELFTSVIALIFRDFFILIGIALVLIIMNWKLALVTFTVLPFVIYASLTFSGRIREVFRIQRVKIAEINTKLSETIGGMRVIQLFRQEKANYKKFSSLNHENYQAGMRQIHIMAVFMPIIELLSIIAVALVIFYGGGNVISGYITLGELVAYISYMRMFFRPIRDLAEKYNVMQNAMASAERIFQLLEVTDRIPQPETDTWPRDEKIKDIALEKVSFSYVPEEPVLKEISLKIKAGDSIAIVGPTGSGKTSLVNLIMRFYDPDSGCITINGENIKTVPISRLRNKMALVMQDPFLFTGTIRDNIRHGNLSISDDETEKIIHASNCHLLAKKLKNGIDTMLAEGGSSISSGERQLISIARAFAHNPELIIMDEATSYVDSETEQHIQNALSNLMQNRTAIIIAHRLSTARAVDKIVVLKKGRIIESGTHEALMREKGFYFRLNSLYS